MAKLELNVVRRVSIYETGQRRERCKFVAEWIIMGTVKKAISLHEHTFDNISYQIKRIQRREVKWLIEIIEYGA